MTSSYWRARARPIIAQVLQETKGQDEETIREALREAYPFGQRRYHPYKIWCSEVRCQLGLERLGRPKPKPADPNQLGLFDEGDVGDGW